MNINPMVNEKKDVTIGTKFKEELPGFLAYAEKCYFNLCKDNRTIQQNDKCLELIEELASDFEMEYETIFEKSFTQDKVSIDDNKNFVKCSDIQLILKNFGLKDNIKQGHFYNWMKKVKGVERTRMIIDGKKIAVITGIQARRNVIV